MNLLIVESPNKIKKLKSILGSGWEVAASVGHIRDLPAKKLSIDKENNYKMLYQINPDKKEVISNLKKKVQQVGKDNVYLATDPDREGEAISFHLCAALGLNYKNTKRIIFHELTDKAIKNALNQVGIIDLKLVSAQESRRAIDRLVGYQVSPVLWKKLESGLSAGRVQSVALRLTVERENVIENFADQYSFQVTGHFKTPKEDTLKAKRKDSFSESHEAEAYLRSCIGKKFIVKDVATKPVKKHPQPPYMTSSLQQDGVKKLKTTVKRVMDVAQKLFEGGHITYMRTDSQNLSETAIEEAKVQIESQYGPAYFEKHTFKSKAGSQEAHEAVRPTNWENTTAGNTSEEQRLYELIYRRALASQMKPAEFDETTITIGDAIIKDPGQDDIYLSKAKVLTFDGYLKAYREESEEEEEETEENSTIRPVKPGDPLQTLKLEARQVFAKPPKRFDQATLVAELEKKQIGRPSTYASILDTILKREYVKPGDAPGRTVKSTVFILEDKVITRTETNEILGRDKNKLIPTERGIKVTEFLEKNFSMIVDYKFTAKCEVLFDDIAEGKRNFATIVPAFDKRLLSWVETVEQQYQDIIPESAIEIGVFEDHPVIAGKGKYGTYVKHDDKYYHITDKEPSEVSVEDAKQAIAQKRKHAAKIEKSIVATIGKNYQIRNGQYGLYVTDSKTSASLPKEVTIEEAKNWTAAQCKERIASYKKWKKQKDKHKEGNNQ